MRRLPSPWWFGCAVLLACSVTVGREQVAFAGEPESKTLFAEGRKLREENKCAEAIIVFRRALDTYPEGLGSLRNIAECETELGLFASARRDWNDLRVAVLQSRSPKYEGWDADAATAKAALDTRVGYVTVQINGERPEGTRIQLNGKTFDPRLIGVELEQDNGALTLEVHYGAATPLSATTVIKEASHEKLVIDIPKGAVGTTPVPGAQDTSRAATARGMTIGGGIALGLGGLAAVGLGVSIGIRQDALSGAEAACPDPTKLCTDTDDVTRGTTASTLINVFAVSAAVCVGVGLTLVLAAPSDTTPVTKPGKEDPTPAPPPANASLELNLRSTTHGGFIGLGGHF
ncbi:MAG: tetratricopeptide repeat protein [Polyangiaceae bacterium]